MELQPINVSKGEGFSNVPSKLYACIAAQMENESVQKADPKMCEKNS